MLSARLRRGRPATRSYKAFYEQFWWETFELKKHIEKIMNDLPGLSEDRKTEILKADDVEHWSKAPDVAQALRDYLVSRDDYLVFQTVMERSSTSFLDSLGTKLDAYPELRRQVGSLSMRA